MIAVAPVDVPVGAAVSLGEFTGQSVIISNQGGNPIYLGTTQNVTTANGFGIPSGSPPLPLGPVTGSLWATAETATTTIGVVVTTPR